jgi:lysozyme family protein
MGKFEEFADKVLRLEGGYVNHPLDKGGPTKYGVILSVWRQYGYDKDEDGDIDEEDIKLLTEEDARQITRKIFWDYFQADKITNQSVAEFIVDWGYNSGRKTAAKKLQRVLNIDVDGIVGANTLRAINNGNQRELFNDLKASRLAFIESIVARKPDQKVFYRGWKNRINSFRFIG